VNKIVINKKSTDILAPPLAKDKRKRDPEFEERV
jgi:hypothetical protein